MFSTHKNFVIGTVLSAPTDANSEIGYLTAANGDTLAITRAQEGSLPMQVAGNWQIYCSAPMASAHSPLQAA
jgi:hypothetical protein